MPLQTSSRYRSGRTIGNFTELFWLNDDNQWEAVGTIKSELCENIIVKMNGPREVAPRTPAEPTTSVSDGMQRPDPAYNLNAILDRMTVPILGAEERAARRNRRREIEARLDRDTRQWIHEQRTPPDAQAVYNFRRARLRELEGDEMVVPASQLLQDTIRDTLQTRMQGAGGLNPMTYANNAPRPEAGGHYSAMIADDMEVAVDPAQVRDQPF